MDVHQNRSVLGIAGGTDIQIQTILRWNRTF
jgi:hypothetical protein